MAKNVPERSFSLPPEPLVRARSKGLKLPMAHLGPLRAPTDALATITQAPPAIGFQSVLATSSLATQALADVQTLVGTAPLSLFLLTVAASGERKSTSDNEATVRIRKWEETEWSAFCRRHEEYLIELEVYESVLRKTVKARSSGEEVIDQDLQQRPMAPTIPRKLLSDITYEGLLHHFEEGDPSVGLFSDEGGQIFGGHAMSKDNQLKTAASLSKLWDGAPLNRTRAGQSLTTFRHKRGCLHIMLQTGIAESVLGNETLRDQGLFSRCLIAWPESHIGCRFIAEGAEAEAKIAAAKETMAAFHARIDRLLLRPVETREDPRELAPALLRLDSDARALLVRFANEVEHQQGEKGNLVGIRGFASKAAEQAARIAGVMTLLDDADATAVTREGMADAIALTSWYLTEAQRTLDSGPVDPMLQRAETLRLWLQTKLPEALSTNVL